VVLAVLVAVFLGACSKGGASSNGGDSGEFDSPTAVVIQGFTTPYKYDDGIEIVPQISTGKVTQQVLNSEGEYYAESDLPELGSGYVSVLLHVKNGSKEPFDGLQLGTTFTYGPDALEPENTLEYHSKITSFNTSILPGRERTGGQTYLVDEKEWKDTTLEIVRDGYPTVIYTGPLV
jgi:hypothetical protein